LANASLRSQRSLRFHLYISTFFAIFAPSRLCVPNSLGTTNGKARSTRLD
jgi:hypothetical protein